MFILGGLALHHLSTSCWHQSFDACLQEETIEEYASSGIDPLTVSLYQMDLDRVQYLLRSYLRIRLQKVATWLFCCIFVSVYVEIESVFVFCFIWMD